MSSETKITVHSSAPSAQPLTELAPPFAGVEPPEPKISDQQRQVMEQLMKGRKISAIAEELDVHRGTIHRWRTSDPNFIAAMNRWRRDLRSEVRDRLVALSESATDAVEKVLSQHDAKVGITLLEKMGSIERGPEYPVDPYEVFGNGIHDETGRWAAARAMQRVSKLMTPEQRHRLGRILAIGVAIDNRREGRSSLPELLELAGPLEEPPSIDLSHAQGGHDVASSHDDPPPSSGDSVGTAIVKVKAHVRRAPREAGFLYRLCRRAE